MAQAFKEINTKTGWFPKLIFCDLILLGEDTVKDNVLDCLGFFLRDEYISDNCLLATCEGKAEDLLNAKVPTDNMTAFALQKILATEAKQAGNISTINLKDFSIGYYAEHKSGYMPYVRQIPQSEGQNSDGGGGGSGGGQQSFAPSYGAAVPVQGSQSSSQKSGGGQEQQKVFDASQTAVFFEGKRVGILNKEQSFAMNLAINSIRQATLEVPFEDKVYALYLTGVGAEIDFRIDNNRPLLNVNIKATARNSDCDFPLSLEEIATPNEVKKEVLQEAEKILEQNLASVFETCRAVKCDIFEVLDKLQKFERNYHSAYKDVILDRVIPSFEVTVSDAS